MTDKRSVHTDALATLGTVIDETASRDAIHLAVEPVTAGMKLYPGQDVGIDHGVAVNTKGVKLLGIVDPFLTSPVQEGEMFWLIVYPRQITSLRHVWEHPDFNDTSVKVDVSDKKVSSEQWLRDFCSSNDCPTYGTIMEVIRTGRADNEEYLYFEGIDAHGDIPDEFWDHVENVLGYRVPRPPRYFSCSC